MNLNSVCCVCNKSTVMLIDNPDSSLLYQTIKEYKWGVLIIPEENELLFYYFCPQCVKHMRKNILPS